MTETNKSGSDVSASDSKKKKGCPIFSVRSVGKILDDLYTLVMIWICMLLQNKSKFYFKSLPYLLRDHLFIRYAKVFEKLTFLTLCYTHVRVRIREPVLVSRQILRMYWMYHLLHRTFCENRLKPWTTFAKSYTLDI